MERKRLVGIWIGMAAFGLAGHGSFGQATRAVLEAPVIRVGVRPVPEEVAQVDVRRGLKAKYAKDYADVTQAGKRRLAGMMMREAGLAAGDAAVFVARQEAKDLAASAGEVELALQAAGEIARKFDVDGEALKFAVISACAKAKLSPQQAGMLARAARSMAETRLSSDDFDGAARAAGVAEESARRTGDTALQAELAMLAEFCRDVVRQAPGFRMATEKLAKEPDDAGANQASGEFLVLVKQEWGRGLLMLSRGTDAGMKAAAGAELASARGAELMEAAEVWAKWGEVKKGPGRLVAVRHARVLFERAAEELSGAEKEKCLERVGAMISLLPAGSELADTRTARATLGETKWEWVEGLKLGAIEPREDLGTLKNWQAVMYWNPAVDERGDLVPLPEESAGARLASAKEARLSYRVRLLCVDPTGRETVLEKEAKVQMRDGGKALRMQGPTILDLKRLNSGKTTPAGVHLVLMLDGVQVAERVWKSPVKRAWWLDESLVERREK